MEMDHRRTALGYVSSSDEENVNFEDEESRMTRRSAPSKEDYMAEDSPVSTEQNKTLGNGSKTEEDNNADGSDNSDDETDSSDSDSDSSSSNESNASNSHHTSITPTQSKPRKAPNAAFGKFAGPAVWKMMEKMGYKHGEGLGKHGEGRVEPINVTLRRAGEGISYSGQENAGELNNKTPKRATPRSQARPRAGRPWADPTTSSSRNDGAGSRASADLKVQYKTLDEIQRTTEQKMKEIFVDMTTNTEVGSLSELMERKPNFQSEKDKLDNDIRLGLDLSLNKKDGIMYEMDLESRRIQSLAKELDLLNLSVKKRRSKLDYFQQIKDHIKKAQQISNELCAAVHGTIPSSFYELCGVYSSLLNIADTAKLNEGYDVWNELGLELAVAETLYPYFQRQFHQWDPYSQPDQVADIIKEVADYFNTDISMNRSGGSATPFESLLFKTLIPRLKRFFASEWDPSHDSVGIQTTLSIIPPSISAAATSSMAMTLQNTVESTNPRLIMERYKRQNDSETKSSGQTLSELRFDFTVAPWLPYIHDRDQILAAVRRKLCTAIDCWAPSKANNKDIIKLVKPCIAMLGEKNSHRVFLKLSERISAMLSSQFTVNAQGQEIWPVKVALQWYGILPFNMWFLLIKSYILKPWLDYLRLWLSNPESNYTEIADWYMHWKLLYPRDIFKISEVQSEFRKALVYMAYAQKRNTL